MAFHVVVPDGVVSILQSVNDIGSNCFMGCKSLKNIIIPDSVSYIGSNAFVDCTSLEQVNLHKVYLQKNVYHVEKNNEKA